MGGVNLNIWTLTDNLCWRTLYLHIRVKCQFLELICIVSGRVQWNVLRTGNVAIKTRLKTRFFLIVETETQKKKKKNRSVSEYDYFKLFNFFNQYLRPPAVY